MKTDDRPLTAALSTLIILQTIMLMALFAGIAPHPPVATPLFGMAPFLAAAIALATNAIIMGPATNSMDKILATLAALAALVSFGPQKYVDAQFPLIWPAVLTAQVAIGVILIKTVRAIRVTPDLSPA